MAPIIRSPNSSNISLPEIRWFSGERHTMTAKLRVHVTNIDRRIPLEINPEMDATKVKSFESDWNLFKGTVGNNQEITCFVMVTNKNGKFAKAAQITLRANGNAKKQTVIWRPTFNTHMKVIEGNFEVVGVKTSDRYNFLSVQNLVQAKAINAYMAEAYCKKDVLEVNPFVPNDEVWEPFEIYKGKYKGAKKFGTHIVKETTPKDVRIKHYEPTRVLDV